jgi:hypothetical protein
LHFSIAGWGDCESLNSIAGGLSNLERNGREGAGPVTIASILDISKRSYYTRPPFMALHCLSSLSWHARRSHGWVWLGRATSAIGDRYRGELDRLIAAFDANRRQQIPIGRIIRFVVATAMRQDEISRVEWADYDPQKKMLLIRDRKDPRTKSGNSQRIPLLNVTGYDAYAIIEEQRSKAAESRNRIFPIMGGPLEQDSGASAAT